jgi:hypothetical protein
MLILDGRTQKDGYTKPTKMIFKGDNVVESCIIKLCELYFGPKVKDHIEDKLGSSEEFKIITPEDFK